ncbi:MAG: ABC transporter permease [Chloroflexota bacterium]
MANSAINPKQIAWYTDMPEMSRLLRLFRAPNAHYALSPSNTQNGNYRLVNHHRIEGVNAKRTSTLWDRCKPDPRWMKVLRDMWQNRVQMLILLLSITAGVMVTGISMGLNIVLSREVNGQYALVNPADIIIRTESFGQEWVKSIERLDIIGEVEGRHSLSVQIQAGPDAKRTLILYAIPDFNELRVSQIKSETGVWPPEKNEVLIERASADFVNARLGDLLSVEVADGKKRVLRVAGTAHDLTAAPSVFSGIGVGYITLDTLEKLAQTHEFNEFYITVSDKTRDFAYSQQVAEQIRRRLVKSNRAIFDTIVNRPYEHPEARLITPLALIFAVVGTLLLLMSVFLIVNVISAILMQQVRSIGVMKTFGARTTQIMGLYLGMIGLISIIALLVALPLGIYGRQFLSAYFASLLNIDITNFAVPWSVWIFQLCIGLSLPLLTALYPVISGTHMTIKEALNHYGQGAGAAGSKWAGQILSALVGFSRLLLLALRNTFRRKGRLIFTLAPLVVGGAIFMTTVSIQQSLSHTLDSMQRYGQYDIEINLSRPIETRRLAREAFRITGVESVEGWRTASAYRIRPDGSQSVQFNVIAPPADTELVTPTLMEGRWLHPTDQNAIVINTELVGLEPGIQVGDEILLNVAENKSTWRVVGVVTSQLYGPLIYTHFDDLTNVIGGSQLATRLAINTTNDEGHSQNQILKELRNHFDQYGLQISSAQTAEDERARLDAQFEILLIALAVMVVLLAVVGLLGLVGTLSINILERWREIGIMRAIGASNGSLLKMIMAESLVIGAISGVIATGGAFLISRPLSDAIGYAFARGPLQYAFPASSIGLWFIVVELLAMLASLIPIRSALQISVRQTLTYE